MNKLWNPYPGVPNPSLAQLSEYVNAAKTPEERNRRKMQVHGMAYSAKPQKISNLIDYLKREAADKGEQA